MSLVRGSEYEHIKMHSGATATGDGTPYLPIGVTRGNYNLLTLQVTGITTATIVVEGTIDENNWSSIPSYRLSTQSMVNSITANGLYRSVVTGLRGVRARISEWTEGEVTVEAVLSALGELGSGGGGGGVTDHALLSNLDYASAGHTGFEEAGTAASAITTHEAAADPHPNYLLESAYSNTIAGSTDFTDTTGAGADGYSMVWDNATSKFILSNVSSGGGGTPGGSNTHVQYNSSGSFAGDSGFTYAGSGVAALSGRLVVPVIRPASDSTTAIRVQNAAGTNDVWTVDTTNGIISTNSMVISNSAVNHVPISVIPPTGQAVDIVRVYDKDGAIGFKFDRFSKFYIYSGIELYSVKTDVLPIYASNTGPSGNSTFRSRFSSHVPVRIVLADSHTAKAFHVENSSGSYNFEIGSDGSIAVGRSGFTAFGDFAASTANKSSIRSRIGVRPDSPNDGDLWTESDGWHTFFSGTEYILDMTPA